MAALLIKVVIHQVLCQLVEGENNFTFEFLGVKVQQLNPAMHIFYLLVFGNIAMGKMYFLYIYLISA